jgi:hypothetical protein
MEDRELLAAIGEVVVTAAALEYAVAILAAVTEGHRDQACEEYAVALVKKSGGGAMGELRKRACAQLRGQGMPLPQIARWLRIGHTFSIGEKGHMLPIAERTDKSEKAVRDDLAHWDRERPGVIPQARCDLMALWQDATAVLDDRHVIAHSIALEEDEADGQTGLVILHPRTGVETRLTTPAVLSHAHDIRIIYRRFHEAIVAETRTDS